MQYKILYIEVYLPLHLSRLQKNSGRVKMEQKYSWKMKLTKYARMHMSRGQFHKLIYALLFALYAQL